MIARSPNELHPEEKGRKVEQKCKRRKADVDLLKGGERKSESSLNGRPGYLKIEHKSYINADSGKHQFDVK